MLSPHLPSFRLDGKKVLIIDAGRPSGGAWPQPQVWKILSGTGQLSWDRNSHGIPVQPGDAQFFEAGERRLLKAQTAVRLLIVPGTDYDHLGG